MKFDYHKHEARVKAKEYWKNRTSPTPTEMIEKDNEGWIVMNHPTIDGLTIRIRETPEMVAAREEMQNITLQEYNALPLYGG